MKERKEEETKEDVKETRAGMRPENFTPNRKQQGGAVEAAL